MFEISENGLPFPLAAVTSIDVLSECVTVSAIDLSMK